MYCCFYLRGPSHGICCVSSATLEGSLYVTILKFDRPLLQDLCIKLPNGVLLLLPNRTFTWHSSRLIGNARDIFVSHVLKFDCPVLQDLCITVLIL
eukprot:scaffold254257_cov14-Tisochrysis_lutea.AAC.1